MRPLMFGLTTAWAVLGGVSTGVAAQYTFTRIADTSGPFQSVGEFGAAVNSSGVVAFWADYDGPGSGVHRGIGTLPLTTIADEDDGFTGFSEWVAIDDKHRVTVLANLSPGGTVQALYRGDGTSLSPIATIDGDFDGFGRPYSNRAGHVAFACSRDDGSEAIVAFNDGQFVTIAETDSPAFSVGNRPVINYSGAVAFVSQNFDGKANHAVLLGNGGPLSVIVSPDDGFTQLGAVDINDQGTIAFAGFDGRAWGVYLAEGTSITPRMISSRDFQLDSGAVAINNAGKVVFRAELANGVGLFHGPDPVADRIIQTGDMVDGQQVQQIRFFEAGLNDDGDLAFYAQMDGGSGIYRARRVCPGDVDLDRVVGIDDLLLVIALWGASPPIIAGADVNGDGTVDIDDLLGVISAWGPCPN